MKIMSSKETVASHRWEFQPDQGWSWVILAAATAVMFVSHLPVMLFSVIYSPVFEEFDVSASKIAWISAFYSTLYNVFVILLGPLCDVFGWRAVAMAGTSVNACSMLLSAFIPSPDLLFLYFSLFAAIGSSTCVCLSFFVASNYFKKYRGMAVAVVSTGACGALLLGPPIAVYLLKEFDSKWTFLIIGTFMVNGIPLASLYHPLDWHKSPVDVEQTKSLPMLKSIAEDHPVSLVKKLSKVVKSTVDNFQYLRFRRVLHICFSVPFMFMGYVTFQMWIPFAIRNRGFSLDQASFCLSASAVTNVIGRLFIAATSDRKFFNKTHFFTFHLILLTISILIFSFCSQMYWIMIFVCLWGFSIGVVMAMYPLALMEVMGLELFPMIYGMGSLFAAMFMLCLSPIVGMAKDHSPSFEIPISLLSVLVSISAVLWLTMPCAVAHDQKSKEKPDEKMKATKNLS